jgi:hypothetical protein
MDELVASFAQATQDAKNGVPDASLRVEEAKKALLDYLYDQRVALTTEISRVSRDCKRMRVVADKAMTEANKVANRQAELRELQKDLEERIQEMEDGEED